jgi:hypothetical protein
MAGKPVGHAPTRVGIPVANSSILINNGDGKHNEDGPVTVALATGAFVAPRRHRSHKPRRSAISLFDQCKEWPYEGQYLLRPSLSHRTAQPEYVFAATEDLGGMAFRGAIPRA